MDFANLKIGRLIGTLNLAGICLIIGALQDSSELSDRWLAFDKPKQSIVAVTRRVSVKANKPTLVARLSSEKSAEQAYLKQKQLHQEHTKFFGVNGKLVVNIEFENVFLVSYVGGNNHETRSTCERIILDGKDCFLRWI